MLIVLWAGKYPAFTRANYRSAALGEKFARGEKFASYVICELWETPCELIPQCADLQIVVD